MRVLRYCVTFFVAGLIFGIPLAVSKELAKVDGFVISDTDFKNRVTILPEEQRVKSNQDKEKLLDLMIDEDLLMREAQKLNLFDNEDYKFRVETFKRQLLVDIYLEQYLKENNTEENQRKYYEENKDKYAEPEKVNMAVITVGSEDEAKDILKKAREGEDFAELARKYSKGPFAAKGGDFGWRTRKSLKIEIANTAFSMKKGEISDPVKTPDGGYSIIKLNEHVEAGYSKFEDVKNRVALEYRTKLIEKKIADVRKAANIKIDSAVLESIKTD